MRCWLSDRIDYVGCKISFTTYPLAIDGLNAVNKNWNLKPMHIMQKSDVVANSITCEHAEPFATKCISF